jgi:hypothetical protein
MKNWRVAIASMSTLAMLGVMALMVPAAGDTLPNDAGTVRLHMAGGSGSFEYDPADPDAPTQSQPLPTPVRCVIDGSGQEPKVDGPLVDLFGSNKVGLKDNSIGIKSGGSTGVPCARVDSSEDLTVKLVGTPNAGYVELDLELKANARINVTLKLGTDTVGTFQVRSGSSIVAGEGVDGSGEAPFTAMAGFNDPGTAVDESIANCKNASDSGPDAGGLDNCRVTVDPELPFDTVVLDPAVGEISLEGSGDFGGDPAQDTIFYLTSAEGVLGCPSTGDNFADDDGGLVEAEITRHENTDGSDCVFKPYSLTATESDENDEASVTFDVTDPLDPPQPAAYEAYLTFDQALTNPLTATLTYDDTAPYDSFDEMPPCVADPFVLDGDDATGSINDEAIPSGDTACVVDVSQEWDGTTIWHIVFTADIRFK